MYNDRYILLTVDVEDWFMVENFKPWIPFSSWPSYDLRVERNTHRILDLLDSVEPAGQPLVKSPSAADLTGKAEAGGPQVDPRGPESGVRSQDQESNVQHAIFSDSRPQAYKNKQSRVNHNLKCNGPRTTDNEQTKKVKATFFVLAWIAEHLPHLVREIYARGHEVASHGCNHKLSNQLSGEALKTELDDSKKILEDIVGAQIYGFRAPSFSIDNQTLKRIEDCGYFYDSSYNSFGMHGRYGEVEFGGKKKCGIGIKMSNSFYELPISNLILMKRIIPLGGGAYFRITPHILFKLGVRYMLKRENAYLFYIHPWEMDSKQPRMNQIPRFYRFRHYRNLDKTLLRLDNLLKSFHSCRFSSCYHYLQGTLTSATNAKMTKSADDRIPEPQ
jgi:polysaccharide deacetylase family protein (PEP-CTERM system associated)